MGRIEPYLFHSVKWKNFDLLVEIIRSGYIKPRCMLEEGKITDTNNIFNGTKYISLTQKGMADGERSSYDELVMDENPCLILKKDNLELITPRYADNNEMTTEEWRAILFNDGDERFSYYGDELQTKNMISLKDNLIAIGLPMSYLKTNYDNVDGDEVLANVREALKESGLDVPILDSSFYTFADNEEEMEKSKVEFGRSL